MIVPFVTPWLIFTEIGRTIVTSTRALGSRELPACAVAAICTTVFDCDGKTGGAVKTAGAPLAVCLGVIVPQVPLQVTFQVTPEFVRSFCTTATTVAVAFVNIVAGGCWVMVTISGADTWKVAIALKPWSAAAYAVIVTVLPTMAKNPD